MTTKEDGGLAFPGKNRYGDNEEGMSLRDWFAGIAIPEMIQVERQASGDEGEYKPSRIANWAYEVADAMLEARKK